MSIEIDIEELGLLLDKVYREGGYDFRDYRNGTVVRRVEKRLHAVGKTTVRDYVRFLDTHPEEYERFAECLTVRVSGFFRNPYTFQKVAELVLPEMASEKRKRRDRNLRVWSTACAQGQEPYSIAILLAEFLRPQQSFNISIHATDISRQALKEAEEGIYSPEQVKSLSSEMIGKYFDHADGHYRVKAEIKQILHFSYFDLTSVSRPPFEDLDLVFCCNILIYLQKQLQKRVLGMLYNSLHPQGCMILGDTETLPDGLQKNLGCLDRKARIYRKVGTN